MNEAIRTMLKMYGPIRNTTDEINALREIIQRITLLGLYRGGFFQKAAFYGGTALRLLFHLDRFSEDMDFCLDTFDPSFQFAPYFDAIRTELERYGLFATLEEKRSSPQFPIESAFVKQETYHGLLVIGKTHPKVAKGQLVKVRLEVDKANPKGSVSYQKLVKLPTPFMVRTLTEGSLFAGKLHAILARSYLNRVKGRDYYDFLFYCSRGTKVNLPYLEAKLRDSGHYMENEPLTQSLLIDMLKGRFTSVDFNKVKQDVRPFIKQDKARDLDDWSAELFCALSEELEQE